MADQNPKSKMRLDWEFLAKEYGVKDYLNLNNNTLQKALRAKVPEGKSITEAIDELKAKGKTPAPNASSSGKSDSVEVVKAEILSPLTKYDHNVQVHAPQIHNHIQPPTFDLLRTEPPRWHEVVNSLWTIGLHMVLGAAAYAVITHTSFQSVAMLVH